MRIERAGIFKLLIHHCNNPLRTFTVLVLLFLTTTGAECFSNNDSPTGTGHETRIVVGVVGRAGVDGAVYIDGTFIGNVETGGTISSEILPAGSHTVRLTESDGMPEVYWPVVTVDLKDGTNHVVNFTADYKKIRVTLGAECIGTVNEATVFINGVNKGPITPGGFVLDEDQPPGTHLIEIKQGTKVVGSQSVKITSYGGTQSINFGC